jgi:hypothetical protein
MMCAILATVMFVVTLYCAGVGSPTVDVLSRAAPDILVGAQSGVSQVLSPWAWEKLIAPALAQPAWTVPGTLAVLFTLAALLQNMWPQWRAAPSRRGPPGLHG